MERAIENSRVSTPNPAEAERLTHELAQVARSVASVLTRPHTAAEVEALDTRADELRRALNAVRPRMAVDEPDPIDRPEWFPQGEELDEWAEIVAHPREHPQQMAEMGLDPLSLLSDDSGAAAGKGLY